MAWGFLYLRRAMVNTTALTLQQCADLAGKRTEPYPEQVAALDPQPHQCRGCGTALHGARSRNTLALRVYCSVGCQRTYQRLTQTSAADLRGLDLREYYWSEWSR
jgi:hypothetical protein